MAIVDDRSTNCSFQNTVTNSYARKRELKYSEAKAKIKF